jgi:16S rRNA A1518/A1519 N6-dimethyltransferase RsmA/KsgA/DIM1 with predicted DNA glycosylase/AP lyase activity
MASKFPDWSPEELEKFLEFTKHCFAQKRKNLLNNLETLYARESVEHALTTLHLARKARAEELAVEELAALFRQLGLEGTRRLG